MNFNAPGPGVSGSAPEERFAIPGAGGIIVREVDGGEEILLQVRFKPDAPDENGLLEIPAGKIRAFESLFDTLRREVKEETGLDVVEIRGEASSPVHEARGYRVLNFAPFSCAQNLAGSYPIMVFVFVCRVEGTLLPRSDESKDYRWTPLSEIRTLLATDPKAFYPMHVDTLRKYVSWR